MLSSNTWDLPTVKSVLVRNNLEKKNKFSRNLPNYIHKRQEARGKRQEARGKRQEARGKRQEARGKRQEAV